MKNAFYWILFSGILCAVCGGLAYRLGVADCRTNTAEETIKNAQVVETVHSAITEKVLATDGNDNLGWLLQYYRRAD